MIRSELVKQTKLTTKKKKTKDNNEQKKEKEIFLL